MGAPAAPAGARDDRALMAAIVARDTSALGQLYDRHAGHVFGLCLRVLRDRMEAEEVLGDIFWEVWQRAERYSPERGAPAAYLATLARSRAIDRLRVRRKAEVVLDLESPGSLEPADAPEGTEPGPFRDAVASEQRQRIRLALADPVRPRRRASARCDSSRGIDVRDASGAKACQLEARPNPARF